MEIELVPEPGAHDPASRAVAAALVQEGLVDDDRPAAYDGAWRRAGLQDAVESSVTPSGFGLTGPGPTETVPQPP